MGGYPNCLGLIGFLRRRWYPIELYLGKDWQGGKGAWLGFHACDRIASGMGPGFLAGANEPDALGNRLASRRDLLPTGLDPMVVVSGHALEQDFSASWPGRRA